MQLHGVQANLPFAAPGFSPPVVIPFVVTSPQCCHVSPPPVTKGQEDRKCYIIFILHLLNTAHVLGGFQHNKMDKHGNW